MSELPEELPFVLGGGGEQDVVSIEVAVRTLVQNFLGDSITVYRRRPQDAPVLPAVTYELTENDYQNYLVGKAGLARATFEFSIWSHLYDDLANVGLALRHVLDGYSGPARSRDILTSLHTGESDEIQNTGDGREKPIFVRTQTYEILYVET